MKRVKPPAQAMNFGRSASGSPRSSVITDNGKLARKALDEVLGHEAGVPGGPARAENEAIDPAEFRRCDVESAEVGRAAVLAEALILAFSSRDPAAERESARAGLIVSFHASDRWESGYCSPGMRGESL